MDLLFVKQDRLSYIELIFIALMIVIFVSPELNRLVSITKLLPIELFYSVIICIRDDRIRKIMITNLVCSLIIAALYSTTTDIVYIEQDASNRILKSLVTVTCQYYSLTFPILLFYRVSLLSTHIQRWILVVISLFVILSVLRSTFAMLEINERISKQGMGVSDDLTQKSIGGYSFVCSIPLIASSLFYLFLNNKNLIFKGTFIILIYIALSFIIKSQYSIALIAGILGILSSIFIFVRKQYRFITVIGLVILFFSLPSILDYFIVRIEGDVHLRMIEIKNFIETGELGDDDMAARFSLYGRAINSFFESPIWGHYKLDYNAHSTFLEILASLGFLGFIPLYKCIKNSFNLMEDFIDSRLVVMLFVPFFVMGMTNPIHASLPVNMVLWFVCPLLYLQFGQFDR